MAAFDKENQPLDQQALNEHIAEALEVGPLSDRDLAVSYRVIKRLFNPMIMGAEKLPDRPCLFVGNHSLFALDGMMMAPLMQKELGRFPRGLGDKFLFSVSAVSDYILKRGAVLGHPQVCSALMENGSDLMVFPGGAHEAVKAKRDMYSLQWKERYGFVKLAAMHGYTIMPFGIVGPDEFYGHAMEGHELPDSALGKLLKRFGVLTDDTRTDMMPPIPVGVLGSLFPKPQRCYLGFGEPVDLSAYEGKKLSKKNLQLIRTQVAGEVEEQLSEMLLLREQNKGDDGLLRRLLTL
ncbi:MAG: lysophospholipid acyltransferase family protein [Halioglobus sp.]